MAAKPKPPEHWHAFVIPELPVAYGSDHRVVAVTNSATGATVEANAILSSAGAPLVAILHPDGRVTRVGPLSHLAPLFLRGTLQRYPEYDSVRLLAPLA